MSATVYLQTQNFLSYTTLVLTALPDGSSTPACTGLGAVSAVSGLTSRKTFTSSSLTGVHYLQLFGNPSNRSGSGYTASSTTSLATAGSGSKAFTVSSGLSFTAGDRIRATSSATSEWMEGTVTAYSSTTLTVTMDLNCGTATNADWSIGCISAVPIATFWITLATSGTLWGADTRDAVALSATITTAGITVVSPLSSDGTYLQLTTGDSYTTALENSLSFTISGQSGLIGSTPRLRLDGMSSDIASAPVISSGSQTVTFNDIFATVTSGLIPGVGITYQIRFDNSTNKYTPIQGKVDIIKGL